MRQGRLQSDMRLTILHRHSSDSWARCGARTSTASVTSCGIFSKRKPRRLPVGVVYRLYSGPVTLVPTNAREVNGWITRVEFYVNGALANTDTAGPFSFNWTNVPQGSYTL